VPRKPLELRVMTPEERKKRDLAIKRARKPEKRNGAERPGKRGPLPSRKK